AAPTMDQKFECYDSRDRLIASGISIKKDVTINENVVRWTNYTGQLTYNIPQGASCRVFLIPSPDGG
ncbi:MAG: hypothetical protein ACYC9P_07985, partial [Rudaea sp.]